MKTFSFLIRETWAAKFSLFAVPFIPPFTAAAFLILPYNLATVPKAWLSLILGATLANGFLIKRKREHLRRHIDEAEFLGFRWAVKANLWNPFSIPELEISKEPSDPARDRVLAELVRMGGPNYAPVRFSLPHASDIATLVSVATIPLARFFPVLMPALSAVVGLMLLLYALSEVEDYLERSEYKCVGEEILCFRSSGPDYIQWNFRDLERKRILRGTGAAMKNEIKEILSVKAGLAAGAEILEIGAGGGFLWKNLPDELKAGWTQAEKNIHASLYAQRHGYGGRFINSDITELSFEAGSFDAIVGLECLDSLSPDALAGFLPKARNLLRPGGKLVHLKDFQDWPGPLIAEKFNLFSSFALGKELVSVCKRTRRFKYGEITGPELSALRAAAGKAAPEDKPYEKVLLALYSPEILPGKRKRVPMLVSVMILKEILADNDFRVVTDCLAPENAPVGVAYLIAQAEPGRNVREPLISNAE